MKVTICKDGDELGRQAAEHGADLIRKALSDNGWANVVLASGTSQLKMLETLVSLPSIEWSLVKGFHLDEYAGIPADHPASFRKYMKEKFVYQVPVAEFDYINADDDPAAECRRLNHVMRKTEVHVAFVGVGENGHLAFNDPPADFETEDPYIIVRLDENSRSQQVKEGWFESVDQVPEKAVSMSISQIMKSHSIVCSCPEERKAEAAKAFIEGPVTPEVPASILQKHPRAFVYLDHESASLLAK